MFTTRKPAPLHPVPILFCLLFLATLISCSHSGPVSTKISIPDQDRTTSSQYRAVFAHLDVTIDPSSQSVTINPLRNPAAHWDVTEFVQAPTCPGCINFTNLKFIAPNKISLSVTVTHPWSGDDQFDAYDVKGIVLSQPSYSFPSGSVSRLLENPDGYTARWSAEPWADINPYVDFAIEEPSRLFESGESYSREIILRLPGTGPVTFEYIVDACWLPESKYDPSNPALSPHCNEAYSPNINISNPLNALPGSNALVETEFSDWQNDGQDADVSLEAPSILPNPISLNFTGTDFIERFETAITNETTAQAGTYPALVCIRDVLNSPSDNLATFMLMEITVTDEIPELVGIKLLPDEISLGETGESAMISVWREFSDGSILPLTDTVEWASYGTDLNGSPLVSVDSGNVTRLSSKWWGGTASVTAAWNGHIADSVIYCEDPFADSASVEFGALNTPGEGYTNPDSLVGPPSASVDGNGSLDVCSFGYGGVGVLEFTDNIILNGPGADFIVYENAFYVAGSTCDWSDGTHYACWNETAIVEVSQDGSDWYTIPFDYNPSNETCVPYVFMDPASFSGLAGNHPVYACVNHDGTLKDGISPVDPLKAGGDTFDLDSVGLEWCRFVRLTDTGDIDDAPGTERCDIDGDLIVDYGKYSYLGAQPGHAGFDGDAVAAVYSGSTLLIK